jgi:hypothetical protein
MVAARTAVIAPLLFALAVGSVSAADEAPLDLKRALNDLLANALEVHVSARILPSDAGPIWNAESTRLTLPGRPIKVRMDGDNVRIYLICTPYVEESGEVLLLAQGQVWLSQPPEKEVKYFNTFSSIPVSFGEKVLYFPLGLATASADPESDFFNIEVEIKVVPYDAAARAETE